MRRTPPINDFRQLPHAVFVTAVDVDSAKRVVFGPGYDDATPISQAVAASCCVLGLFPALPHQRPLSPERGEVIRTLSADVAVNAGANIVIGLQHLPSRGARRVAALDREERCAQRRPAVACGLLLAEKERRGCRAPSQALPERHLPGRGACDRPVQLHEPVRRQAARPARLPQLRSAYSPPRRRRACSMPPPRRAHSIPAAVTRWTGPTSAFSVLARPECTFAPNTPAMTLPLRLTAALLGTSAGVGGNRCSSSYRRTPRRPSTAPSRSDRPLHPRDDAVLVPGTPPAPAGCRRPCGATLRPCPQDAIARAVGVVDVDDVIPLEDAPVAGSVADGARRPGTCR